MKTIVIGAGASGLVAAIYASKNSEVLVLEKNNVVGKKLLLTGNGKCNYFNSDMSLDNYNTSDKELLEKIMTDENKNEILNLFSKIGIIPKIKNGYYYPYSNQAISVRNALYKELELNNVKVVNEEVKDIKNMAVITDKSEYQADKIIVATGGLSYPKTGSDGLGYNLALKFGHMINKPYPALTGLKASENFLKDWSGIRCDVKVKYQDKEEAGEIQLTDYGVSGICVFNLSSIIAKKLDFEKQYIYINFVPFLKQDIKEFLINQNKIVTKRTISEILDGFLNYKLGNILLKLSKINQDELIDNIDEERLNNLCQNITNFKLEIIGTNTFDNAQTTTGGIPLNEVDLNMMSKKINNIYFVGELLDVDGKCGGYNLAFAFITGMIAGKHNA